MACICHRELWRSEDMLECQSLLSRVFETDLVTVYAKLVGPQASGDSPASIVPSPAEHWDYTRMGIVFYLSSWGSNSGPQACVANTFLTEPSPRAISPLFFDTVSLSRSSVLAWLADHGAPGISASPPAATFDVSCRSWGSKLRTSCFYGSYSPR